jgi:hypothetical protein
MIEQLMDQMEHDGFRFRGYMTVPLHEFGRMCIGKYQRGPKEWIIVWHTGYSSSSGFGYMATGRNTRVMVRQMKRYLITMQEQNCNSSYYKRKQHANRTNDPRLPVQGTE